MTWGRLFFSTSTSVFFIYETEVMSPTSSDVSLIQIESLNSCALSTETLDKPKPLVTSNYFGKLLGSKWCINKNRAGEKASLHPKQTRCLLSVIWQSPQPSLPAFRAWLWGQPAANRMAHCTNQTVPRAGGLCLSAHQLAHWQTRNLANNCLIRMVPVLKPGNSA